MAAMRGGWRMRGIGSVPWWQMCNAVKTGETIGMRMWDVGWASHVRGGGGGLVAALSPPSDPAGGEVATAPYICQIRKENRLPERMRRRTLPSTPSSGKEGSCLLLSIGRPRRQRLPAATAAVVVQKAAAPSSSSPSDDDGGAGEGQHGG
uniref:Uncharacterized protein n=1 Tax=Oryza sativa subsp. japonica TaxID=39947 RepID=Q2QU30_ORYSJ|nr:hypothetical protein LOC_Os12g17670 [Oryza sativa Japonica Group]